MRLEDSNWNVLRVGDILIIKEFITHYCGRKLPVMALVTAIKIQKPVNPRTLKVDKLNRDLVISSDSDSSIELNFKFWFEYFRSPARCWAHEVPRDSKLINTFFALNIYDDFKNNWDRLVHDDRIHKIGSESENKELLTKDYWSNNGLCGIWM